jgi:hypothetical protein
MRSNDKRTFRRMTWLCTLAAAVALLVAVLPAAPAAASPAWGVIYGYAQDANTFNVLPGIKVQAFAISGSSYVPGPFTFTDNTGNYAVLVARDTTYCVLFTDPHTTPNQVYADRAFATAGYVEGGTPVHVTGGDFEFAHVAMYKASIVDVTIHRAGQWSTPLKNMTVRVTDLSEPGLRYYTTDKNGSVLRGGVPAGNYAISVWDPSHTFGSISIPPTLSYPLSTNSEWIAEGTMPLTNASADISVSKPSCNSSVKHGKKLKVSGTLSHRVTSPKKVRLDAYQWSPSATAWVLNKQADLKIKKSGKKSAYSGSIKLPHAGSWRLVAVFPGNSTYAQSGSSYKKVTAK